MKNTMIELRKLDERAREIEGLIIQVEVKGNEMSALAMIGLGANNHEEEMLLIEKQWEELRAELDETHIKIQEIERSLRYIGIKI